MHPAAKFYALVSTARVAAMFFLMAWIVPIIQNLSVFPAAAASIAGVLGSVGIYRLVSQGAEAAIHHIAWLQRWIFGGTYLHGTWVGHFIGRAGDKRYTVEHIDQDLDGIVINGQSRTDAMQAHADWTSVSVSIDSRTGRLIFSYTMTILSRQGTLVGINASQLERASHRSAATAITGHAQDLGDQVRVQVTEVKVADDLLPWEEAFKHAQTKFPRAMVPHCHLDSDAARIAATIALGNRQET
jgi:hypothetical protein